MGYQLSEVLRAKIEGARIRSLQPNYKDCGVHVCLTTNGFDLRTGQVQLSISVSDWYNGDCHLVTFVNGEAK